MNGNGEKVSLQWLLHLVLGVSGFLICTVGALAIYIFTQTQGQVHDQTVAINDLYSRVQAIKDNHDQIAYRVDEQEKRLDLLQTQHDANETRIQALEKATEGLPDLEHQFLLDRTSDDTRLEALEKAVEPLPDLAHQVNIDHEFFLNHLDADKAIDIVRGRRRK